MNKKLLAIAVGAALAAGAAVAQADVKVYGAAHLSIDNLDNGNTADSKVFTLASNSSYIGFKAEEDLGGGMKALAGAEWQVALDTGTTGMANRNTFVGLQGGFGTVRLGNYDDVVKQIGRAVDFFMNEQLGESRALTRALPGSTAISDERLANSINYESPDMGGLTFTLNYGLENTVVSTSQLNAVAFGVQYKAGPLYVGLATKTVDTSATTDLSVMRLSASYTMGDIKVAGLYQKDDVSTTLDRTVMGIGASMKVGSGTIKGQFYQADDAAANDGADMMALGYDHSLSKTTTVYVTYAKVSNGTAGTYSVIGAGHSNPNDTAFGTIAVGNDVSGFSLGMKMAF